MTRGITRRTFLGSAALGAAAVALRPRLGRAQTGSPPFLHGVASGDPLSDRVVIWTRVTPAAGATPGTGLGPPVEVAWEVAADPSFVRVVACGTATATAATD